MPFIEGLAGRIFGPKCPRTGGGSCWIDRQHQIIAVKKREIETLDGEQEGTTDEVLHLELDAAKDRRFLEVDDIEEGIRQKGPCSDSCPYSQG